MTQITKTEHGVKVTRYTWKCPGCGCAMNQGEKPEQHDLKCYPCILEDGEQKWHAENAFLLNSTITALLWTTSMGFRGIVVCGVSGNEWSIRGPMTCEAVTK